MQRELSSQCCRRDIVIQIKKDGLLPVFFFFCLACFLKDIQKRFVLFTAVRAHIQMFPYQRHQLCRVFLVDFSFHILVDSGVNLITGCILLPYAFEYAQEAQDSFVRQFLLAIEAILDLLDDGSDVHNLCFLMFDMQIILLMLKKCQDFVGGDILHRKSSFEP
jgi:hypothetical protein